MEGGWNEGRLRSCSHFFFLATCYKPDMVPAPPSTRSTKVPDLLCNLPMSPSLTYFSESCVRSKTQEHPPLSGPCPPCSQLPTPLFSGVSSSSSELPFIISWASPGIELPVLSLERSCHSLRHLPSACFYGHNPSWSFCVWFSVILGFVSVFIWTLWW